MNKYYELANDTFYLNTVNLRDYDKVVLKNANLENVEGLQNLTGTVVIDNCEKGPKLIDARNADKVIVIGSDLSNSNIIMPRNGGAVLLVDSKLPAINLDETKGIMVGCTSPAVVFPEAKKAKFPHSVEVANGPQSPEEIIKHIVTKGIRDLTLPKTGFVAYNNKIKSVKYKETAMQQLRAAAMRDKVIGRV